METSYYILENKKHPGWYKLGITNDPARRLEEHGEEWFRTVECLPVGARAEAQAFETRIKQRYSSRSMRKGTEDFPLTFTEVESLRQELKAEHQRTRPKDQEAQSARPQPAKPQEPAKAFSDPKEAEEWLCDVTFKWVRGCLVFFVSVFLIGKCVEALRYDVQWVQQNRIERNR